MATTEESRDTNTLIMFSHLNMNMDLILIGA